MFHEGFVLYPGEGQKDTWYVVIAVNKTCCHGGKGLGLMQVLLDRYDKWNTGTSQTHTHRDKDSSRVHILTHPYVNKPNQPCHYIGGLLFPTLIFQIPLICSPPTAPFLQSAECAGSGPDLSNPSKSGEARCPHTAFMLSDNVLRWLCRVWCVIDLKCIIGSQPQVNNTELTYQRFHNCLAFKHWISNTHTRRVTSIGSTVTLCQFQFSSECSILLVC